MRIRVFLSDLAPVAEKSLVTRSINQSMSTKVEHTRTEIVVPDAGQSQSN